MMIFQRLLSCSSCFQPLVSSTILLMLSGCASTETETQNISIGPSGIHVRKETKGPLSSTVAEYKVGRTVKENSPKEIEIPISIDGTFIGIANYSPKSGKIPTPAMAIGAAYAHKLFTDASRRNKNNWGNYKYTNNMIEMEQARLELITNLALDPTDPNWGEKHAEHTLNEMGVLVNEYDSSSQLPKNNLWPLVKGHEDLTKKRILELADEQANRIAYSRGKTTGIFFIAAHGQLGPDGERYFFASDSVAEERESWVSYQEVLGKFDVIGDQLDTVAYVIFDTCLTITDKAPEESYPLNPPDSVVAIAAASPGQFSRHWQQTNEFELIEASKRLGFLRSNVPRMDLSYYDFVSSLPIAMGKTAKLIEHYCPDLSPSKMFELSGEEFFRMIQQVLPLMQQPMKDSTKIQTMEIFRPDHISVSGIIEMMGGEKPVPRKLLRIHCDRNEKG